MMNCHLLTFLLLSTAISCISTTEFNCTPELGHINDDSGTLVIKRTFPTCGFDAKDGTKFFAIKTNDLNLRAGDKLIFSSTKDGNKEQIYQAPFDSGYIVSGLIEPDIKFEFSQTDNITESRVDFLQNVAVLPIDGDINNSFDIVPLAINSISLDFTKSIAESVHLEVIGAKIVGTGLTHMLISTPKTAITINFEGNQNVRIKTSQVYANCSAVYSDADEISRELTGPDASSLKQKYQCVNIFKFNSNEATAHYEADFKNFLDLVDSDDELILDDGSSETRVNIVKAKASSYAGQLLSFKGKELVVVYNSPRAVDSSKIQFKLTVQAKKYGGIIDAPDTLLAFPSSGEGKFRYVLKPQSQQYAAIEVLNGLKLQGANLTVSSPTKTLARFMENAKLPPIIASNEQNVAMTLEFSAKSFNKLVKSFKFKSLSSTCHKLTPGVQGGFSVIGPQQESCYWTLGSSQNVNLKFDYNDFIPNGCLTIQPMFEDKPIYHSCNLSQFDVLPTFVLNQAYVIATLPSNGTRLDASLSASQYKAQTTLESTEKVAISSPSYPVSYDWSNKQQIFTLNGTGKNYLVTATDVDIRKGEQLLVNNVTLTKQSSNFTISDFTFSNTTIDVTIVRSSATNDFTHHRGFKLSATQFDQLITANITNNRTLTPANLTSIFLKISSPGKGGKFGKRVVYNITTNSASKDFDTSLYDGRSIRTHTLVSGSEKLNGSTTSDTLLVTYRTNKPNVKLPIFTFDYTFIDCNVSADHLCDNSTRCVPVEKLCQGKAYCDDGSDIKIPCKSGPSPLPKIIEVGLGGFGVFVLCVLMLSLGVVSAIYGPNLYKMLENRFRSGQYTTFSSVE